MRRRLNEYPVFVRYNEAIEIFKKVNQISEKSLVEEVSTRNPFGISTKFRGEKRKTDKQNIVFHSSDGISYINRDEITKGKENIDKWKIMVSRVMSEHAGEPDKTGKYKVIARMEILPPEEICSDTYLIIYPRENREEVHNVFEYLKTKFVRFLILQLMASINLARDKYEYVPLLDFSRRWSDADLYEEFDLTKDEIALIESTIKPMK